MIRRLLSLWLFVNMTMMEAFQSSLQIIQSRSRMQSVNNNRRHGTRSMSLEATAREEEGRSVRQMLDDAVQIHMTLQQQQQQQQQSIDENHDEKLKQQTAEDLILQVGTFLYQQQQQQQGEEEEADDDSVNDDNEEDEEDDITTLDEISKQLDQAVLMTTDTPELIPQVELLAQRYHNLLNQQQQLGQHDEEDEQEDEEIPLLSKEQEQHQQKDKENDINQLKQQIESFQQHLGITPIITAPTSTSTTTTTTVTSVDNQDEETTKTVTTDPPPPPPKVRPSPAVLRQKVNVMLDQAVMLSHAHHHHSSTMDQHVQQLSHWHHQLATSSSSSSLFLDNDEENHKLCQMETTLGTLFSQQFPQHHQQQDQDETVTTAESSNTIQDTPTNNILESDTTSQDNSDNTQSSNSKKDKEQSTTTSAKSSINVKSTTTKKKKSNNVQNNNNNNNENVQNVDVAIVGAGIGGLAAGAILNTLYGKKVGIYEAHSIPGGCAHAFDRTSKNGIQFTFDSGPTILLGCSSAPYNPLQQILKAIDQNVDWIPYQSWGMIEHPTSKQQTWTFRLGPDEFENGPLLQFGGPTALNEFRQLCQATKPLVTAPSKIPALAMRAGKDNVIPLLRFNLPQLFALGQMGNDVLNGTFGPYLKKYVRDPWLLAWLDALAFSLSGLPASRTSAAAMAYVLYDLHRDGAVLDYPRGGLGSVVDALVRGVRQGNHESDVYCNSPVRSIDFNVGASAVRGLTLQNGQQILANDGVIMNAPVWCLKDLITNPKARRVLNNNNLLLLGDDNDDNLRPRQSWIPKTTTTSSFTLLKEQTQKDKDEKKALENSLLAQCETAEMTGSFLHLHLAIKSDGLNLKDMQPHYTVMDRGLLCQDNDDDGPCGELNMIAVSNPCQLDDTLAPDGYIILHAYGAGNEPYSIWENVGGTRKEYEGLKEKRAAVLWRAVESIIPDVRERVVLEMIGSPKTHERFLRRPRGTYGAATEDYLPDGSTPYEKLVLAGDGVFPGIGVPSVALSGASAANALVSPLRQWNLLGRLKRKGAI